LYLNFFLFSSSGDWSDNCSNWSLVSESVKNSLEFKKEFEGEFWMTFEDFYLNFDLIQFCHLSPDSLSEEVTNSKKNLNISWNTITYHDEWIIGKSAGGSGNGNDPRYWTNPQFFINLVDVDPDDNEDLATVVVSLMQKYTREKRREKNGKLTEEYIQFRLFKIKNESDALKAKNYKQKLQAHQLERVGNSGDYINKREITKRFRVPPGDYLIIPSLYDADVQGEFMLRIFTEKLIKQENAIILENQSFVEDSLFIKSSSNEKNSFFSNNANMNDCFSDWANKISVLTTTNFPQSHKTEHLLLAKSTPTKLEDRSKNIVNAIHKTLNNKEGCFIM
jgi:hypothetical protein